MIKDTFFSMPRFVNLCRKDMVENWRSNVLRIVLMYGVMALIMIWNGYFQYRGGGYGDTDPAWRFLLPLLMWGLWTFGCLSASFTMEKMKTKTSRLSVLMTPATPFEKYISRWLVSTVVFLVVFLIAYKLADYTRVLVYTLKYPDIDTIAPVPLSHCVGGNVPYYTLTRTLKDFMLVIGGYFFFQSCFVLGSSIWPKNAFLKTFVAGVIITIFYVLVTMGVANLILEKYGDYSGIYRTERTEYFILSAIIVFFTLMNWTLAYFRFKEAEIINRM